MKKVDELREKCRSNSTNPEYWLELEKEFKEFWKTASEEDRKIWFDDWGCGEVLHMMCSGIRFEQEHSKKK